MLRLVFVLLFLPLFDFTQTNSILGKQELTNLYSKAISDYITAIYKKNKSHSDTLFFGKNPEFPDIKLPKEIQQTKIVLLSQEQADKKMLYKKSLVYINLIGWQTKDNFKFLFVVFALGYRPQYNCEVDYTYSVQEKNYKLERLEFKYPYTVK